MCCALLLLASSGETQQTICICVMIEERMAKSCVSCFERIYTFYMHFLCSEHCFDSLVAYIILVVMNCTCMNKVEQFVHKDQ